MCTPQYSRNFEYPSMRALDAIEPLPVSSSLIENAVTASQPVVSTTCKRFWSDSIARHLGVVISVAVATAATGMISYRVYCCKVRARGDDPASATAGHPPMILPSPYDLEKLAAVGLAGGAHGWERVYGLLDNGKPSSAAAQRHGEGGGRASYVETGTAWVTASTTAARDYDSYASRAPFFAAAADDAAVEADGWGVGSRARPHGLAPFLRSDPLVEDASFPPQPHSGPYGGFAEVHPSPPSFAIPPCGLSSDVCTPVIGTPALTSSDAIGSNVSIARSAGGVGVGEEGRPRDSPRRRRFAPTAPPLRAFDGDDESELTSSQGEFDDTLSMTSELSFTLPSEWYLAPTTRGREHPATLGGQKVGTTSPRTPRSDHRGTAPTEDRNPDDSLSIVNSREEPSGEAGSPVVRLSSSFPMPTPRSRSGAAGSESRFPIKGGVGSRALRPLSCRCELSSEKGWDLSYREQTPSRRDGDSFTLSVYSSPWPETIAEGSDRERSDDVQSSRVETSSSSISGLFDAPLSSAVEPQPNVEGLMEGVGDRAKRRGSPILSAEGFPTLSDGLRGRHGGGVVEKGGDPRAGPSFRGEERLVIGHPRRIPMGVDWGSRGGALPSFPEASSRGAVAVGLPLSARHISDLLVWNRLEEGGRCLLVLALHSPVMGACRRLTVASLTGPAPPRMRGKPRDRRALVGEAEERPPPPAERRLAGCYGLTGASLCGCSALLDATRPPRTNAAGAGKRPPPSGLSSNPFGRLQLPTEPPNELWVQGTAFRCDRMVFGSFIGGGICGKVFKCVDSETGKVFAAKQIVFNAKDPRLQQRLRQLEIEIDVLTLAAKCAMRSIVLFYGARKLGHAVLMFLEYCTHKSLLDFMAAGNSEDKAVWAAAEAAAAGATTTPSPPPLAVIVRHAASSASTGRAPPAGFPVAPLLASPSDPPFPLPAKDAWALDEAAAPQMTPLSIRQVQRYLRDVLQAVDFLHRHGYAHMDIKTANILVNAVEEGRLADLGCAVRLRGVGAAASSSPSPSASFASAPVRISDCIDDSLTELRGTALYMAPEMIRFERGRIGAPADVWSLGCVALEMATGSTPWRHLARDKLRVLFYVGSSRTELPLPPLVVGWAAEARRWLRNRPRPGDEGAGATSAATSPPRKACRIERATKEGREGHDENENGAEEAAAERTPSVEMSASREGYALDNDAFSLDQRRLMRLYVVFEDFARSCVRLNPEDRPSAEALLRHPFITL